MRAVIACDEYCCKLDNEYYLRDFSMILINRYLMSFDEISFAVRTREVLSSNQLGKYKYCVDDKRISIVPVSFFQGPSQFLKIVFKQGKSLKSISSQCDVLILRLPSTTAFLVSKYVKDKPIIVEAVADCHDMAMGSNSWFHKCLWLILHRQMQHICKRAIGVSCVTEQYLQKHYRSKLKNSVFSNYSSIELLPDFYLHPRHFPEKNTLDMILVANQVYLDSRKGHKVAIDILSELRHRGVELSLTFVGEDYYDGINKIMMYAKSLGVADCLHCTGFVNTNLLRKYLLDADILLLPTTAEGLPRVIIEGMALGLPCITTPVSGNPELIDKSFLFNYNDVRGMTDCIVQLITNKDLYEQQSSINFQRSLNYSKTILDSRRKEFFDQIINLLK